MTKLLKKYYAVQKRYRKNKIHSKSEDVCAWSKSLNEELEKILASMSVDELNYLLKNTSGMFCVVIKEYLDKAVQKKLVKETVEEKSSELVFTACV